MKQFECKTPGIGCSFIPEEIVYGCNYCLKKTAIKLTEGQRKIINSKDFIGAK